jgi:hypothetical protein
MQNQVELNPGEVKLIVNEATQGKKVYLKDLGLNTPELDLVDGNLRLVIQLNNLDENHFGGVPTIHLAYTTEMGETHWQVEFNGVVVLDKKDHHGHSTVLLLNKSKLNELAQRHENNLIVHGDLPSATHLNAESSYLQLF